MNIKQFMKQKIKHFDQKLNSLAIAMRMLEAVKNTEGHTADQLNKHNENCNARYAEALSEYKNSLRELIEEVRKITDTLLHYVEHDSLCIRTRRNSGRPTEDGGYEEKFGDIWYESRPVDKTPKCDCGLTVALQLLDEARGGK